jgi:hypothetical protein
MPLVTFSLCLVASNDFIAIFSLALRLLAGATGVVSFWCPSATSSFYPCTVMNASAAAAGIRRGNRNCWDCQNERDDRSAPAQNGFRCTHQVPPH